MNRGFIHIKYRWIIWIAAVWVHVNAFGQIDVEHQTLLWTKLGINVSLEKDWRLRHGFYQRWYLDGWRQHHFISQTHIEKQWTPNFRTALGFTHMTITSYHENEADEGIMAIHTPELRPQIELFWRQPIHPWLSFSHRYWMEVRIPNEGKEGHRYSHLRMRYKIQLSAKLSERWTAKVFEEIFINSVNNHIDHAFDQNRWGVNLQYRLSSLFSLENGYVNWFHQRTEKNSFYSRHAFRLSFVCSL